MSFKDKQETLKNNTNNIVKKSNSGLWIISWTSGGWGVKLVLKNWYKVKKLMAEKYIIL